MKLSGNFRTGRYRHRLRPHLGMPSCFALLDLFFLLLFFLLMASSVIRISGIKVDLPKIKAPQATDLGKAIVTIAEPAEPGLPCRIYFRDRLVDENILRSELFSEQMQKKVLIIRADRNVSSGVLAEVMAIAEAAGMESFIAVQTPKNTPETRFE